MRTLKNQGVSYQDHSADSSSRIVNSMNPSLTNRKEKSQRIEYILNRVPKEMIIANNTQTYTIPQYVRSDTLLLRVSFKHQKKCPDLQTFFKAISLLKSQSQHAFLYISARNQLCVCDCKTNSFEEIKSNKRNLPGLFFLHIRNAQITHKSIQSGLFKVQIDQLALALQPPRLKGKKQLSFFAGGQLGVVFRGEFQVEKILMSFEYSELKFSEQCQNGALNNQMINKNIKNIRNQQNDKRHQFKSIKRQREVFFPFIEPSAEQRTIINVNLCTIKRSHNNFLKNSLLENSILSIKADRIRFSFCLDQLKLQDHVQLKLGDQLQKLANHAQLKKQLKNNLKYHVEGKGIINFAKLVSSRFKLSNIDVSISYYGQSEQQQADKMSLNLQIFASDQKQGIQRLKYSLPIFVYDEQGKIVVEQQSIKSRQQQRNKNQNSVSKSKVQAKGLTKNFKPQHSMNFTRKVIINRYRNQERFRQYDRELAKEILQKYQLDRI